MSHRQFQVRVALKAMRKAGCLPYQLSYFVAREKREGKQAVIYQPLASEASASFGAANAASGASQKMSRHWSPLLKPEESNEF